MSEHLDLGRMDMEKLAAVLERRFTQVVAPEYLPAASVIMAKAWQCGICLCRVGQFFEQLAAAMRLAIADVRSGQADRVAPPPSAVADRLLSELFTGSPPPENESS